MRVHLRSLRHYVNAGISIPLCMSNAKLLDLDTGAWPTTGEAKDVTCLKCKRMMELVRGKR